MEATAPFVHALSEYHRGAVVMQEQTQTNAGERTRSILLQDMEMMQDIENTPAALDNGRLSTAVGLTTLQGLRKTLDLDQRRTEASVSLNRSMQRWIEIKGPAKDSPELPHGIENHREALCVSSKSLKSHISMAARKTSVHGKRAEFDPCILSMEQAFIAHSAAFDLDAGGPICVEELILILQRCSLFDDFFTPNKVRNYFCTWAEGCNELTTSEVPIDEGLRYQEFEDVLRWGADIKGVDFTQCAQRVVRLSRKLCDKSSSVQRRLEVVFDAFCKKSSVYMSAFEFGGLCQKVGVYQDDKFTMGDVYSLFYQISGEVHGEGVDFEGFISVLKQVGERLEIGEAVFEVFAKVVSILDADEETIARVKMRLRKAAGIVGGSDWRFFFHQCDPDNIGFFDWAHFLQMCRDKLHLNDRENSLRVLFDKLDLDGSGELQIDELIAFIEAEDAEDGAIIM